ncbi:MAG: hypothetical protein HN411_06100 [Waddliaceae bacterium]|jgi:hypoxanthine phosphoribosyltransferase|nr:hypothetical protein [Waddliaceae bacterium]MBT3578551.1 hypothetical protein [Waddliaceae bacterium]MBT4444696.1 hypothetical protein [Waddliaceae bacterium]MBT6928705.1 hypothetical protein [Waddliaceae bacterium]MBT7264937.1 hypothetical protein [Waddliaceae bacterium]
MECRKKIKTTATIIIIICVVSAMLWVFGRGTTNAIAIEESPAMLYPTWNELQDVVADMCRDIDGDEYDVIMGISVGGLAPTVFFSEELHNKNVTAISAKSYDGKKQGSLIIRNAPEKESLEGKRILLIDDVVDTAITINSVKKLLIEEYDVATIDVATLYVNYDHCKEYPRYWGIETTDWIVFPWEKED